MANFDFQHSTKIYNRHFAKQFILMLVAVLALEIIFFAAYLQQEKRRNEEIVELLHESEVALLQQSFETELRKVQNDIFVLKDSNDIATYLAAPNSDQAIQEIIRIFKNFQSTNKSYHQLTLLNQHRTPIVRVLRDDGHLITQWSDEINADSVPLANLEAPTIVINNFDKVSSMLFSMPLRTKSDDIGGYLQLDYDLAPYYQHMLTHAVNHPNNFYGLYSQEWPMFESEKKSWVVISELILQRDLEEHLPSSSAFIHVVDFNPANLVDKEKAPAFSSTEHVFLTIQTKKPSSLFWTNPNIRGLLFIEGMVLLGWILIAFYLSRFTSIRKNKESQNRLMSHVFDSLDESLVITDSQTNILYANPAFCKLLGYAQDELINLPMNQFQSKHHAPAFYRNLWDALNRDGYWEGKLWDRTHHGEEILQWVRIFKIEQKNESALYFGIYNDIDPTRESKLDDYRMRYYDVLTDLPNESLLPRLLTEAITAHEKMNLKLGVATIQLQNFCSEDSTTELKNSLLKAIADRLIQNVDPTRGILSRSGLREFTLLYPALDTQEDFFAALAKTKQQLDLPFNLVKDQTCKLDYDIGLSLYPTDGNRALDLLGQARIRFKDNGKLFSFDKNRSAAYTRYFTIDSALRNASIYEELFIEYQPQVDPITSQPCALEALLRWKHPDLGRVSPSEFIPIAESNGSIVTIGEWILMQVFSFQNRLVQEGIARIPISINISTVQLEDPHFYEQLRLMLTVYDFPPSLIELELTESLLMKDIVLSKARINAIKTLGVKISIDDFGTGYSSLAYLKELHTDKIKIDRLFIKDYPQKDDGSLLKSISHLLHGMSYTMVMEGVETKLQMIYIQNLGIELIQGYYYSKPRSSASTISYLTKNNPTEA